MKRILRVVVFSLFIIVVTTLASVQATRRWSPPAPGSDLCATCSHQSSTASQHHSRKPLCAAGRTVDGNELDNPSPEHDHDFFDDEQELGDDETAEAWERTKIAVALATARISMSQAIQMAIERVPTGKPYMAGVDMEDGEVIYYVGLLDGREFIEVRVNAVSGKVMDVVGEEDDEREPQINAARPSSENFMAINSL